MVVIRVPIFLPSSITVINVLNLVGGFTRRRTAPPLPRARRRRSAGPPGAGRPFGIGARIRGAKPQVCAKSVGAPRVSGGIRLNLPPRQTGVSTDLETEAELCAKTYEDGGRAGKGRGREGVVEGVRARGPGERELGCVVAKVAFPYLPDRDRRP